MKKNTKIILVQQIVNKEFNFAPFFLSTALSFFAVAKAMPVKLALYKEKNEAKYTTHYLQIAALVIYLACCLLNVSLAQGQLNDTISINEVVVTGSKTEVTRKLVPISVSQVSNQDIENTGEINVLPALCTYSPGIFITERNILGFGVSTGGSGTISIRGISGSPNTSVLVLIDGHPQYQGIFGHPLPDAYLASDVEKVEIIRGPASILYGSNAMGGAVNIITKQQHKEGANVNIGAAYGSYNTQKYNGKVGYKKNKLSIFTSVNHNQTDGIRNNTDYSLTNGYTKIGYRINKHMHFTADFNLAKYNANDNGSIHNKEPQPFNIDITRGKTALSIENRFNNLDGALKVYHNFGTHDLSDGWHSTDRNSGAVFYQTLQLLEGNRITAGIDAKQFGGKGNSGAAKDSLITINELAFYVYMQQSFLKKLTLSAGLRLDHNSCYGNEVIPMVGINFIPTTATVIKTSVSKGFRSPTVMEMYLFAPNPDLKPEEMLSYELGWLQYCFNNRLQAEFTLFVSEGSNIIQVEGQYPNVKRQNVGSFANKGVEFDMKIKATEKLYFGTNYSYLRLDKTVLAAPKHQSNFSANYTYKMFNFNLSAQYIDKLNTSITPEITQSYILLNTRLTAQIQKNVNTFVMVKNLFNEEYEINYGYPMPKINFSVGIKLTI